MQELVPCTWDDLILHRDGVKVPADKHVTVGFNGQWFELDLTAENAMTLDENLAEFLRCGSPCAAAPAAARSGLTDRKQDPERRAYLKRVRGFIDANPQLKLSYRTTTGKIYYPKPVLEAYDTAVEAEKHK